PEVAAKDGLPGRLDPPGGRLGRRPFLLSGLGRGPRRSYQGQENEDLEAVVASWSHRKSPLASNGKDDNRLITSTPHTHPALPSAARGRPARDRCRRPPGPTRAGHWTWPVL